MAMASTKPRSSGFDLSSSISCPSSISRGRGRVSRVGVQRAVSAILRWKKSNSSSKNLQLSEESDNDFIYLLLTLKKIPQRKSLAAPSKILLPHPLLPLSDSPSEFCLIIDDRPKPKPRSKLTADFAQKKIASENIPIAKVLKISKLKSEYQSFESKHKLYDSFDMFFVDKRVVPMLPKLLGKPFFKKKKKVPVPVDLTHNSWKEQIEKAYSSALLCLSTGTCSVVRVGRFLMDIADIVDNVLAAIDGVVEVVPKKWSGVKSFHLKFSDSLALPIYQALPDDKLKIEGMTTIEFKKDEKLGLAKDQFLSAPLTDANVVDDGNQSEDDITGGADFAVKNRKNDDSDREQLLGELNGETKVKKMTSLVGKGSSANQKKLSVRRNVELEKYKNKKAK